MSLISPKGTTQIDHGHSFVQELTIDRDGYYKTPTLCITAYNDGMWLYSVRMFELQPDELKLNSGRFERYTPELYTKFNVTTEHASSDLGEIVDWIHLNTKDAWCFYPSMRHIHAPSQLWCFVDKRDALMFRLRW
jgi:hypothetical protein